MTEATTAPDPAVLPAVRSQIEQAQEKLLIACKEFRRAGWTENADELAKEVQRLRVWTQKDGWLDYLGKD